MDVVVHYCCCFIHVPAISSTLLVTVLGLMVLMGLFSSFFFISQVIPLLPVAHITTDNVAALRMLHATSNGSYNQTNIAVMSAAALKTDLL